MNAKAFGELPRPSLMNFTHYDLGYHSGGQVIVVTLSGTEANICLMYTANFQTYQARR